jgi:hypothetical protein
MVIVMKVSTYRQSFFQNMMQCINGANRYMVQIETFPTPPPHLVLGVIDHGWLPLPVHLVVPVLGLGGLGVGNVFRLLPVFRLKVNSMIRWTLN